MYLVPNRVKKAITNSDEYLLIAVTTEDNASQNVNVEKEVLMLKSQMEI